MPARSSLRPSRASCRLSGLWPSPPPAPPSSSRGSSGPSRTPPPPRTRGTRASRPVSSCLCSRGERRTPPPLPQGVHQVDKLAQRAPEGVQLPHDELVALTAVVHGTTQFRPVPFAGADLLLEDLFAPEGQKIAPLEVRILVPFSRCGCNRSSPHHRLTRHQVASASGRCFGEGF